MTQPDWIKEFEEKFGILEGDYSEWSKSSYWEIKSFIAAKKEEWEGRAGFAGFKAGVKWAEEKVLPVKIKEARQEGYERGLDKFLDQGTEREKEMYEKGRDQKLQEILAVIEKFREDRKTPHQAIYFKNRCPGCGENEVNNKFVNVKFKEAVWDALEDLKSTLTNKT